MKQLNLLWRCSKSCRPRVYWNSVEATGQ